MIKKVLTCFLCIALFFGVVPIFAAEADASQPNEFTGLLKQLGIFENEEGLDAYVTRGEFAGYIAGIFGISEYSSEYDRYFEDVPKIYRTANRINGLAALGIINGGGDSLFYPDDNIKYIDALTILIKAMGENSLAEIYGGYPSGYMHRAVELGITSGNKSESDEITKADAAKLIFDALNTEVLEVTGTNGSGVMYYTKSDGNTFLYRNMSIRKGVGTVTAGNGISLTSAAPPSENHIVISGTEYKAETSVVNRFLGHKVTFYYTDYDNDDEHTVLYMYDVGSQNIIEMDYEDYISFDPYTNTLQYYKNDKKRSVNIEAGANITLNGEKTEKSLSEVFSDMKLGQIKLYNTGGGFSAVVCENYEVGIVSVNNGETGKLYAKYITGGVIDKNDYKTVEVYLENGESADFSEISAGSIISVARSADYIKIYVSRNIVTGVIEEISDDGVTVDGTEYRINKYLQEKNNIIFETGDRVTISVNHAGYIVECNKNDGGKDFGYLIDTSCLNTVFEDTCKVKLFTMDGKIVIFDTAEKITVDGIKCSAGEVEHAIYSDGEKMPMLIVYNVNKDGEINMIDTPSAPNALGAEGAGTLTETYDSQSTYYLWSGIVGRTHVITDATKIIMVPDDDKIFGASASDFIIGDKNMLEEQRWYKLTTYQYGADKNYEDVAVIKIKNLEEVGLGSKTLFVQDVYSAIDSDDKPILKIEGYTGTEKVEYIIREEDFENFNDISIERGDVLYISVGINNRIDDFKYFYKYKDGLPSEQWGAPETNTYGDETHCASGWAVRLKNDILQLGINDSSSADMAFPVHLYPNAVYFNGKTVWVAPLTEIITSEMNPNSPDRFVAVTNNTYISCLYVYRDE